jgi:hypothetical protein
MRLLRALVRIRNTKLAGALGRASYVSNWLECMCIDDVSGPKCRTGQVLQIAVDVQDASGAAFRASFRPIASSKLQLTISERA